MLNQDISAVEGPYTEMATIPVSIPGSMSLPLCLSIYLFIYVEVSEYLIYACGQWVALILGQKDMVDKDK